MNNGQPWLEQAALADFMKDGFYESHLRRIRRLYLNRRNALLDSLKRHFGSNEVLGAEAGMHLVWRIPKHLPSAHDLEKIALSVGVGVYTVSSGGAADLCPAAENDRLLVLGFSSLSEREIELGISRLAQALAKINPLAITRGPGHLPKGEIHSRSKGEPPHKQKRPLDRRMLA
jgi:GntR family transcriptional regulator/MocR family aminotransferase